MLCFACQNDASSLQRRPRLERLHAERAVEGNLLFDMLSLPARQAIFRSMALQMVSAGTTIISQGDTDATKFYVLEKGTCDVLISSDATGNLPRKVHTYTSGRCAPVSLLILSSLHRHLFWISCHQHALRGRSKDRQSFQASHSCVSRHASYPGSEQLAFASSC